MTESISSNKRIAKNTMILYMRMLLTIGISFYTTRLVLQNLGVSDYGLYGIVGSLMAMMYTVTSAISQGVSRFLTFGLGKGNMHELRRVFSTSMIILVVFSLLVVLIGETIGVWYINNKLNVETGRLYAANWVFQFVIINFILELICVPYDACIVAHERMKAFAFVAILKVLLSFAIAVAIVYSPIDRLIAYAMLVSLSTFVMRLIYYNYCHRNFEECRHITWQLDKSIFKDLLVFSSWTFLTSLVCIVASTGTSLVVNFFYGTVVNAAQNVAAQINSVTGAFLRNFSIAFNPQLTKSYASGDKERALSLLYFGAKVSFLLLYIIALPVMFEVDFILDNWLEEIPPYSSYYVIFGLISSLCSAVLGLNATLNAATGDIKYFQISMALGFCIPLPMTWILLQNGFPPYWSAIALIVAHVATAYWRISINRKHIDVSFKDFAEKVFLPIFAIIILSCSVLAIVNVILSATWIRAVISVVFGGSTVAVSSYFIALSKSERMKVKTVVLTKLHLVKR